LLGLKELSAAPIEIQGIELQRSHAIGTQARSGEQVRVHHADIFRLNLAELPWENSGPLLVVGNPPWVTNSELGSLDSANLPSKSNFKGLSGFDAKTGGSNFDIAEYIWIKLIKELSWARPTIALLCKTSVARNVLSYAECAGLPCSSPEIYLIDARKWFRAAVDACLFRLDVGLGQTSYRATVFSDLESDIPQSVLGLANGSLVSDYETYERLSFLEGNSPVEWRQGIKHDAGSVMELREENGALKNRLGEIVTVEPEYLYPLLKSSDLNSGDNPTPRYRVIVTQKQLGEDTSRLRESAPHLWDYLCKHEEVFSARKSSIYKGRPRFSMFGVGEYSFADYKVAISGLYKTISFRVVGPRGGTPVMLDDTCYFVGCESAEQASVLAAILGDERCLSFVNALIFLDSKRPLTKKILQRLNLRAILERFDRGMIVSAANERLKVLGKSATAANLIDSFRWPGTESLQGAMFPELMA
jgi:hypothetical protein